MRAVMAFSGGMDSTSLLMRLLADGYTVDCLSYEYGQKHNLELDRAKQNISYLEVNGFQVIHRIVDLSSAMNLFHSSLIVGGGEVPQGHYEEEAMKATVVPNRNAIFASILYGYALSIALKDKCDVEIALGVHSGDHEIYPDCRPEFYQAIGHAFAIGNWDSDKVSFKLPYLDGDKESILRDAEIAIEKLGLDFATIYRNTNTSYDPDELGRASGTSGADIERILAFHAVGKEDPVEYVNSWNQVLQNALQIEKKHKDEYYKQRLTELQYNVTRESGTEAAFSGMFWDEKRDGEYSCLCCGHILFNSEMKYDSGCGWPSFHSELDDASISRLEDNSHGSIRTEVRCSKCDAHLGHVFGDGPIQFGGERYCINSAAIDFEER
ncbi:MAG TPA: peptide-methionine (R)-S-oxide reductase MsrB [Candidatus Poseidoniales archaeon]|nr:peptide-methionine (R)-S-oxide reductase MsrB [Candidatus Poseidoniales archaeon]